MCEKFWTLSSKHPDRGCVKASHDGRISGRGEFNRASPKKMCEKFWTLSSKHPDRGCAKASHDGQISGRGELDRASPKKMCKKFWTLSGERRYPRRGLTVPLIRKDGLFTAEYSDSILYHYPIAYSPIILLYLSQVSTVNHLLSLFLCSDLPCHKFYIQEVL